MRYISLVLMSLMLWGCSNNPKPQPPPQPPPTMEMAVVVRDYNNPAIAVADVAVTCNGILRGFTDDDGYLVFGPDNVPVLQIQRCLFTKDGYLDRVDTHVPGPSDETLYTEIEKIPPTHPNPAVGKLSVRGGPKCFHDDSGCVNPVYAHFGDAFSYYTRDPNRVQEQLDKIAAAGYRGVRVWAVLGGPYWAGREVGPDITEGYWSKLIYFLRDLKSRELTAVWSMGDIGQMRMTREAYMLNLANLDNIAGGVIEWLDCGNEAYQTGEPSPEALARCVTYFRNAGGQALLTLTSPPGETKEELDRYSINPADAFDVHGYRGGRFWDKIRHIFSIPYEVQPMLGFGIQSEPWGNGELVSVTENKGEIDDETSALGAIMSVLTRQAWVWFSGEGVKLNEGLETQSGFLSAVASVRLIPRDVTTYETLHHSGDRWASVRTLIPPNVDVRVDGRTSDSGRTVQVIYGPSGTHVFTVARRFEGKLCHPVTLDCNDVVWSAGSQVTLTFTRGRLLIGQLR